MFLVQSFFFFVDLIFGAINTAFDRLKIDLILIVLNCSKQQENQL